jgi:erythromycin esterase-like protein
MGREEELARAVADAAVPLESEADLDPLLERIGDARLVLLGEATHGTAEFYRMRALLTARLLMEKGFRAVAVEGDWPDAYRVNRFVRGVGGDASGREALADFRRFPAWMWRNVEALRFIEWLRAWNGAREAESRAGFYGLDLYSLHASIEAVLAYLDRVEPEAAARARARYECFEELATEPQRYGYAATLGLTRECEDEVVLQLLELRRRGAELLRSDGLVAEDAHFEAEQNARVVQSAEEYYRAMFRSSVESWNLRDTHMADTVDALVDHLGRWAPAKLVVWAHNSHVGDARGTELGDGGELSLGQLVRRRHGAGVVLVGFSTYEGAVTAASDWGSPAERKRIRPALEGSYEALFHRMRLARFFLDLGDASPAFEAPRLERAIGVVYKPKSERQSHYFYARLGDQFDALVHVDHTRALEPLERGAGWERGEAPETFPTGV